MPNMKLFYLHAVCSDKKLPELNKFPPPNFTELYHKIDEIKKNQHKGLQKIDKLMEDQLKDSKKIHEIKEQNNDIKTKLKKIDMESHKRQQKLIARFDIIDKNDEEIKKQIKKLSENDEDLKKELKKLGENDTKQMKKLKEIAEEVKKVNNLLKTLEENDQKMDAKLKSILNNQKTMFATITDFSEEVKLQYENLSLYDQEIIKKQIQFGLMQDLTIRKIDEFTEESQATAEDLRSKLNQIANLVQTADSMYTIKMSIYYYEQMNRYSFNLFKEDAAMKKFVRQSETLDFAIEDVLTFLHSGGLWDNGKPIFEDEKACSTNFFEKIIFMIKHGIQLFYIRSVITGIKLE